VICVLFPGFFAPYGKFEEFHDTHLPPQALHVFDENGSFHFPPFVYAWKKELNPRTWKMEYTPDTGTPLPVRLFVRGTKYSLFGVIECDLHLFGAEDGHILLVGTDHLGRDQLSRTIYGSQISLTIGFVGVLVSLILGLFFGGVSGLFGGAVDDVIQRVVETLMAIPKLPLWMALAAAVPKKWSAIQVYFAITIILSLIGWTGLARVVRSKFMSLREEDFVMSARLVGASELRIVFRHMVPSFASHLIASLTMSIPGMILGETTLSFIGLGLQEPAISWGVLLRDAQAVAVLAESPWLLIPGIPVVIVVLAFNFLGDGIRDAADPYAR